ncbi:hypothetical protein H0H93_008393 [Arthromyces matolae]|nr:hypothetical protein H0H93_008393 [Arthromyces matolae]
MTYNQTNDVAEVSGTTVAPVPDFQLEISGDVPKRINADSSDSSSTEEQALESHEVIELQTFSERKAWIEEKIKFLEQLPDVKVYAGLDAVRISAEHVPGMPTQEELNRWIVEQDTIEKETEIFDRGELTKLRQLTKAAAQRNLSPADTDVIELTLTTILRLDKLLHLLRDRSENLELLGIRLTWEETRILAWIDRRKILEDVQNFLDTRVRWTPSIYESVSAKGDETPNLQRRGSITSFTSASSDASFPILGFSRGDRFKLAESLSHDAAQFAGRVTSLRHGKIANAGKILDKLIDHSRKPVPDELLDEQDKLEEKGINEMENLGMFILNMVVQWRKADEIFVETMKDKSTAHNLLEEIETARLYHPTARQSASFMSRSDALIRRLALRGNSAMTSSFPSPEHPLFSDQRTSNQNLAQFLSSEIITTSATAQNVENTAKEYRAAYEAVKRVEDFTVSAKELTYSLNDIFTQLQTGISDVERDGSPPNLKSTACLGPEHHSAFLARFPSILDVFATTAEKSKDVLRRFGFAILGLDHPGIDNEFVSTARLSMTELQRMLSDVQIACEDMTARCDRLTEARRLHADLHIMRKTAESVEQRIFASIKTQRWRSVSSMPSNLPVSDTPTCLSPETGTTHAKSLQELLQLDSQVGEGDTALHRLSNTLEDPLQLHLSQQVASLKAFLQLIRKQASLLHSIQRQTAAMKAVYDEFCGLRQETVDLQDRINACIQEVLRDEMVNGTILQAEADLQTNLDAIQVSVAHYISSLSDRIPFIGHGDSLPHFTSQISFTDSEVDFLALDSAVRSDSNSFALTLGNNIERLAQQLVHLHLAHMAKEIDIKLVPATTRIRSLLDDVAQARCSLSEISSRSDDIMLPLTTLCQEVEHTISDNVHLELAVSEIRTLLHKMEEVSNKTVDTSTRDEIYVSRRHMQDETEVLYNSWGIAVSTLLEDIKLKQATEARRLVDLMTSEALHIQVEEERVIAETSEHLPSGSERLEKELLARNDGIQTDSDHRLQEEGVEKLSVAQSDLEQEPTDATKWNQTPANECDNCEDSASSRSDVNSIAQEAPLADDKRLGSDVYSAFQSSPEEKSCAENHSDTDQCLQVDKSEGILIREQPIPLSEDHTHSQSFGHQNVIIESPMQTGRLQNKRDNASRANLQSVDGNVSKNGSAVQHEDTEKAPTDRRRPRKINQLPDRRRTEKTGERSTIRTSTVENDMFGPGSRYEGNPRSKEMQDLHTQVMAFRRRIRAMNIHDIARPKKASSQLPTANQWKKMDREFSGISSGVSLLPFYAGDSSVETDLRSLRTEIEDSAELMKRIECLSRLSVDVQKSDTALSDLLEHIDSYPSTPAGSSAPNTHLDSTPEEQLTLRLAFTRSTIESMVITFGRVSTDSRAISEKVRILQTWSELEDMGHDLLGGRRSRPTSVVSSRASSGRPDSSASTLQTRAIRKGNAYSGLSVSSTTPHQRLLPPKQSAPRRVVSGGSVESQSRPDSQLSNLSSNRAVSGPFRMSVYNSTFASRQRTSSMSNPLSSPSGTPTNSKTQNASYSRVASPTESEVSYSRLARLNTKSSTSMSISSWSRAPRNSLSSIAPLAGASSPPKRNAVSRKTYVADPKNKLDVAVGDVVNQLPVSINVEGVSETWKDQSGKYWIGNQDPKLCFCRILRSQTVMVRVGGGWSELSKFIRDHFADSFRLLPDSPPRLGTSEEKWISSTTLLEAHTEVGSPPVPPRTPEPALPFIPSFSLSTPNGKSPRSLHSPNNSPSTKGSPLTPLQFIRRADMDNSLRPGTPTKPAATLHARGTIMQNHATTRNLIWRP